MRDWIHIDMRKPICQVTIEHSHLGENKIVYKKAGWKHVCFENYVEYNLKQMLRYVMLL